MKQILLSLILLASLVGCTFEASVTGGSVAVNEDLILKVGDSSTALEVDEGSSLVFVVSQNKTREVNTELQITVSGDSAGVASAFSGTFPQSKSIPSGQTSASIVLATIHDLQYTGPRSFTVTLSAVGSNVNTSFLLTVKDLEAPPQISFSSSSQILSEGAGSGSATLNLSNSSNQSITVAYSFADGTALRGTHFTGADGSVTFAPGETSKSIAFNLIDDVATNATRDFDILLGAITGSASLGLTSSHTVNVLDNETPTLAIGDASGSQGGNITFTVTLSPTSFQSVTVNYGTSNNTAVAGTHFTSTSGTLTFNPGDSSKTFSVPATSVAGEVCAADRNFSVTLSSASNAAIGVASGTGTISDPKVPSISIADSSATEGSNVIIVASLSQACANKTVSFSWATADGSALSGTDYGSVSSSASITAGNLSTNLSISTVDNLTYQGSRAFSVSLSGISNATGGTTTATGTINDDEFPLGSFSISGITATNDALNDAYLSNATSPTVNWGASTNATSYDDHLPE